MLRKAVLTVALCLTVVMLLPGSEDVDGTAVIPKQQLHSKPQSEGFYGCITANSGFR